MYRVETQKLSELLRMWLEDNQNRRSNVQVPPRGECYTNVTDEYGCVWVGSDDGGCPPHLVDRTIEHYLNERSSQRDTLVSSQVLNDRVRFVWRIAD